MTLEGRRTALFLSGLIQIPSVMLDRFGNHLLLHETHRSPTLSSLRSSNWAGEESLDVSIG
jgi:hypothetical protein